MFCDVNRIEQFFDVHMEVLCGVNPMMLFNMDEKMINTRKKLKVLVNSQNGVKPLVVKPYVFPT